MTTERRPVLIVEDDEATQSLLRAVLRRSGYESEVTSNGGGAIELLREKEYAVVVLDMMMPEVGGREVIAFLAAESRSVPVIICSAAGPRALENLDESVVKAVVRKPFDVDEFLATVASVAEGR